jgi:hypothetical protein
MIYFNILLGIIAVISIVYAIFNPMDILSWWWVKSKKVAVGIWNLIKGIFKK